MRDFTVYPVRSAAILTTGYVAGTVVDTQGDYNQAIINVAFTIGSLTSAELKIEFSNDGTNYYQETNPSVSAGITTETLAAHTWTATGNYRIPVPILDRYIKISIKGTGTVTSSSAAVTVNLGRV